MIARADNDLEHAERLPVGFRDPKSPHYIPAELRDAYLAIPPGVEEKLRRNLYGAKGDTARPTGDPRNPYHVVDPSTGDDAFATVLVWRKVDWVRLQLAGQRVEQEQDRYDAERFTCSCCSTVKAFDVKGRRLVDGSHAHACADCYEVLNRLALDHLAAARLPDGTTRLDAARRLLTERSAP